MSHHRGWTALACSSIAVVLLAAAPASARAQDLEQRVQELEAKVDEMEKEKKASGVEFDPKKLRIESADGQHSIRVGGRLMIDGLIANEDGSDDARIGDGSEIRRARIFLEGKVYGDWEYKGQFDFAPGDEVEVKDAYIRYAGLDRSRITLGHYKEPFSLEELTSSKYITFMERAMPVEAFAPSRNLGIGANTYGAVMNGTWTGGLGFFGEGFDDNGSDDEGYGIAGRLTVAPIAEKTRTVHFGGSFEYRDSNDDEEVRFRARPEMHATSTRLVDTGTITDAKNTTKWGIEATGVYGPFSVQGEYIGTSVDRSGGSDPDFSGWYAYGSYFLTGESRAYSTKTGAFGRVKPARNFDPFNGGGPGAWEVGVRFSSIDLSDSSIRGGEEDNLTVGVNWYVNPQIRFMANYVQVLDLDKTGDPLLDGSEPGGFQLRAQVDF
ncbi:MAG: porin [Gammaproteobacteria bacterium]|nr:porin [Gammaproteobacteria bacterium]NIR84177.1 porin [Gammaproteobacteria bacterium]NIR89489.1 porin [Gammaproteobacteria bacterium]NIU05332.1 porin [Gammaproteobacteria bacterium]NIV52272.1 porin [Gammaproteobacteria bacterium]